MMTRDELIAHFDALAQRTDPTAPPDFERASGHWWCLTCKRVVRLRGRVLACGCGANNLESEQANGL